MGRGHWSHDNCNYVIINDSLAGPREIKCEMDKGQDFHMPWPIYRAMATIALFHVLTLFIGTNILTGSSRGTSLSCRNSRSLILGHREDFNFIFYCYLY